MSVKGFAYISVGIVVGWLLNILIATSTRYEGVPPAQLDVHQDRLDRIQSIVLPSSPSPELVPEPTTDELIEVELDQRLNEDRDTWSSNTSDLAQFYDLVDELLLFERFQEAFNLIYERRLYLNGAQEIELLNFARQKVEILEQLLAAESRFEQIVDVYRMLVNMEPENSWFYLRLVHWLIVTGDIVGAELSMAALANNVDQRGEVESLQARIDQARAGEGGGAIGIPLEKVGEHYVVRASIDGLESRLMIDTGATMTIIRTSYFDDSGLSSNVELRPIKMNSAGGVVEGQAFTSEVFEIGALQLNDIEIGTIALPNFKFDGLLGMNVLSNYRFFIDQQSSLLVLE